MNFFIITLSILSLIAVIVAIVFEGMLKNDIDRKPSFSNLQSEFKKLSIFGWTLIIISIVLGFGNGFTSIKTINDNNNQYAADTLKFTEIIKQLKEKRITDSLKIKGLESILKENGIKSDSIKLTLVDNAVKAMDELHRSIDRERENIFSHFQKEVEENLRKIIVNYQEPHVKGFLNDTFHFFSTRLDNQHMKKYESISTNRIIIGFLMETSAKIDVVNNYANMASESLKLAEKQLNIRMFLTNINALKPDLLSIYRRIYTLNSYKKYERLDFNSYDNTISDKALEELIQVQFLLRENLLELK